MQVDLGVAMIIAVQVGTTTALTIILKGIISRLDKQNGNIADCIKWQQHHVEAEHLGRQKK